MKKVKIGMQEMRAGFAPNSFNAEENTVEIVWSTGAQVKRNSFFDGPFIEELSMKKAHVRLDRLNSGAPLLNNHNMRNLEDVIGVVEKASIKDNQGIATVRLSSREEIKGIVEDIKNGIIRNISVGYVVHKIQELKEKSAEGLQILRAIDWEPMELSFVGIPADAGAHARNQNGDYECEITTEENEGENMKVRNGNPATETTSEIVPTPEETTSAEAAPVSTEAEPTTEERKTEVETPVNELDVRKQEIKRGKDIKELVRTANLETDFADKLIENENVTLDDARKAIFGELEKRTNAKTINQKVEVRDMEMKQLRKEAAVNGLLNRSNPDKYKLKADEREFRQGSLIDSARHFLALEGVSDAYQMSRTEVAKRALHSSSDFPEVLANVSNKSLMDAYQAAPSTYAPFVKMKNVADFKEISSIKVSNGGKLEKVLEHGEYKRTTLEESAEKYKMEKFGLVIGKTWELMINDDLGAFTDIAAKLGQRAREKENEIFWSIVLANGIMNETGLSLFNAGHGNLAGVASAISIASIGAGRAAMKLQKDMDGELIQVAPSYLVVPAALETIADQFVSNITATENGKVNPFSGRLQVISEARLDAASQTAWYLFSSAAQIAMVEMAKLEGRGPEIFTREGFDVDGMETKIRYVFGMKALDYRGFYKNAGV